MNYIFWLHVKHKLTDECVLIIRFFTCTFCLNFGGFSLDQFLITAKRLSGSNLRCKSTSCNAIKVKSLISLICKSIENGVSQVIKI